MKKWNLLTLVFVVLMSGCAIKQNVEPVTVNKGTKLCIIKNPKVKTSFIAEIKNELVRRNIPYTMVPVDSAITSCNWSMTYTANWSWDLALYMVYAKIEVFKQGQQAGKAEYDARSGSGNMNKFIDAQEKIKELLSKLIQQTS